MDYSFPVPFPAGMSTGLEAQLQIETRPGSIPGGLGVGVAVILLDSPESLAPIGLLPLGLPGDLICS